MLFLGRLRRSNGLMTLIDAWPEVLAGCPEARLWLIGDGPLRDALNDRIRDLQLQSKVVMPGSFDEVADVLSAADAAVCPTPEPGMPLALLEATAACLPIVAIGGIKKDNLKKVMEAGADAAAVISAVMSAADTEAATRQLVKIIEEVKHE